MPMAAIMCSEVVCEVVVGVMTAVQEVKEEAVIQRMVVVEISCLAEEVSVP